MANISQTFQSQSTAIATYDYIDIADGSGYVVFYGFASTDSAATTYLLARNVVNSDPVAQKITNTSTDVNLVFNSSTFNAPRTLKGDIYFAFTQGVYTNNAASIDVTCEAFHYDGTTETSLGAAKTSVASSASSTTDTDTILLSVTAAQKRFKIGDLLRVKVTVNPTYGAATANYMFCHDPLNRDASHGALSITAATNPTYFKVSIPFRIEI